MTTPNICCWKALATDGDYHAENCPTVADSAQERVALYCALVPDKTNVVNHRAKSSAQALADRIEGWEKS